MLVNKDKIAEMKENWLTVTWDEVVAYIGPNAQAFKPIWEKGHTSWKEKGVGVFGFSWCWPALIPWLGIPWAAARKLWTYVGVMVALIVVLVIIGFLWPKAPAFTFVVLLGPVIGKPMYIQYAVAQVAKIKKETMSGVERDTAFLNSGGLNMKYGYIAAAVSAVVILLLVAVST